MAKLIVGQHCSKSEQRYKFYQMPGNDDDQQLLFLERKHQIKSFDAECS